VCAVGCPGGVKYDARSGYVVYQRAGKSQGILAKFALLNNPHCKMLHARQVPGRPFHAIIHDSRISENGTKVGPRNATYRVEIQLEKPPENLLIFVDKLQEGSRLGVSVRSEGK